QWRVPQSPSNNCCIRYIISSGPSADTAITPGPFEIIGTGNNEQLQARENLLSVSGVSRTTKIILILTGNMDIRLSVYDAKGALIEVLNDGRLSYGKHEFTWRAGKTGAYFVLAESSGWHLMAKVVIVE
ncbi:MAG: hypothetical protein ACPL68_05185, partial [Candidatus Hydrothermia bacterium]